MDDWRLNEDNWWVSEIGMAQFFLNEQNPKRFFMIVSYMNGNDKKGSYIFSESEIPDVQERLNIASACIRKQIEACKDCEANTNAGH